MKRIVIFTVLACAALSAFALGGKDERPVLSYLAWNLGASEDDSLERRMLKAFQAAHPEINLVILEVPAAPDGRPGSYESYINTLAARQSLPDVYMYTSIPDATARGWTRDVTSYTGADKDFARVNQVLRENAQINGRVYGIPSAVHFYGMAVNLSIFDELNVEPLGFNYTLDQLRTKIGQVTTNKYKGIDIFDVENWGPAVLDPSLGFATFDGKGYHFSSPAFAQVINMYRNIITRNQTGNQEFIDPASWLPPGPHWAWGEGYIAFQYEASWAVQTFVSGERPYKADMLPLPGQKVVLVPDYIFIGAETKLPDLAYELARWMTYGEAGQKKRVEFAKAGNFIWNGVPLCPGAFPEVDNFFLSGYRQLPSFVKIYQMLQQNPKSGILEGFKVVPGFNRSRHEADTGVLGMAHGRRKSLTMGELITAIIRGDFQLADYASEMDRIANNEYRTSQALLQSK